MEYGNLVIRSAEWVMGQRNFASVCTALAKLGLRGLGVNVHYDLNRSGELVFLDEFMRVFPKCVCFDVGAHVGEYSEALLSRGAALVIAFEPTPSTYSMLRERIGHHANIRVENSAVGELIGDIHFDVPILTSDSTLASRDIAMTAISANAYSRITVAMTSLDAFAERTGIHPDFVKIDVEGYELEVILGMTNLLLSDPPKAIQFEFNQHLLKRHQTLLDFSECLKEYSLFRLASHSMRPLDPNHYLSNIYTYSNIVALHSSCVSVLCDALC